MNNNLKYKIEVLPTSPGCYIMKDKSEKIIYIGKAKNLKNRVSQYFINNKKPDKVRQMVDEIFSFDYIITNSELEALTLENNLIKKHKPFYNILLKDDKAYPYLKIDLKKPFPKLEIVRKVKKDGCKYFGPYFGAVNAYELVKLINTTFLIRDCSHNIKKDKLLKRECLNYEMHKCLAPCVGKVMHEQYLKNINDAINFLKGDIKKAVDNLTQKMDELSAAQQYERAIEYRDYLKMVTHLKRDLITENERLENIDIFNFYNTEKVLVVCMITVRNGKLLGLNNYEIAAASLNNNELLTSFITQFYEEKLIPKNIIVPFYDKILHNWLLARSSAKCNLTMPQKGYKKALLDMALSNAKDYLNKHVLKLNINELKTAGAVMELKELLSLSKIPYRIEGYDISNISGSDTVASMVVFVNGKPAKSHYRKFKIISVNKPNDFESMKEVLTRRIKELDSKDASFSCHPDLILIDGGKGQLSYANEVLKTNNVNFDIISLAKKQELIFKPNSKKEIVLNKNSYGLKLLQRVRDESHRFAVAFHRKLRDNKNLTSELTKIKLIGEAKAREIMKHFKSIQKIKEATVPMLMEVKGISQALALNIFNYFKNQD